jgi:hypothetical protein
MNIFKIPSGVSSYYQGFWNESSKTFERGSDIDIFNNCIGHCENQECNDERCILLKKYCYENCYLFPESRNTIINCARDNTCGRYPNFDKKCLEEKKDVLINCCKRYCNVNLTDCNKDCNEFYKLLLVKQPKDNIQPYVKSEPEMEGKNKNVNLYYVIILTFLFFLILSIKMKK